MIDEEACLPAFASDTDSLGSSDTQEYVTNDGHRSSYIEQLEHAIEYLMSGKKVVDMPVGKRGDTLESLSPQRAGDTLCKGQDIQDYIPKENQGCPGQHGGTAVVESELLASGSYDTKKVRGTISNQNIPAKPISAEDAHSLLLSDKPIFGHYLRNDDMSEMHRLGSPIMPPKVAAMCDTEIDGESFDARPSNYRSDDLSITSFPKIGLMGGTGRRNPPRTTRKTRSSNTKTAAEKVVKDTKPKKPTKNSSKAKKGKATSSKDDNDTSNRVAYPISNPNPSNQKLLDMFIDDTIKGLPPKGLPPKPDKVAIPLFDPYKEVWHDAGPNQIYLSDSHYAANMMSAEVDWDIAQDSKRRGDPMYGPTDPRSSLNPLKRPRRPPVSGKSRLTLPDISSKYDIDKLHEAGTFKW